MLTRNLSCLFVAATLVVGVGCGDDDTTARDSGTTLRDSGTILRDSGTILRDSGTNDGSAGDSSAGDAATDGGPPEMTIVLRFAHLIGGAGPVGVCADTGTEITLLNSLLSDGAPPALGEGNVTDFVLAPVSALPAGTTLEVYAFDDISGTACPDGTGSEEAVISVALADLNIDPENAYTIAAVGDLDASEADDQPTLIAVEEVFAPMDSGMVSITVVNAVPGSPPVIFCQQGSSGSEVDLIPDVAEGLEFKQAATTEVDHDDLDAIGGTLKLYFLGLPVDDGGRRCTDFDGSTFTGVRTGHASYMAIPNNGGAVTLFRDQVSDTSVTGAQNIAPAQ